ncbi:MAG TPA: extracellular solute-binding protein [Chloroflexota bacterium]|nr:extracellular solute-binding protein [Chloroflexota bacterium]
MGAAVAGTGRPWGRRGILEWGARCMAAGSAVLGAACGAGTSSAPASPTSAPRNVTVSFAPGSWGTRAGRKEVTEGMLKEVGVKLPHITVDLQLEAPSPTPNQTWITRVVSGDVPDLVISSGALFEWMARRNVWADMRPALQKIGWKQGDFFANPNTLAYAGKQHAVPFVAHQGGALVYNKSMFGEAGLPEPTKDWTWDDVLEAARRLTRPEKGQWGINGNFGHGTFFSSVWANNGEVLNRDHSKTLFAGPEGVEALELLAGLTTRHRVSPPPQQISAERLAFNSGSFAMEINTPGRQSDAGVGGKFEWDVTFFPRWPKTKKRVMIADFSEWAVTSGAARRDVVEAATQLAAFYTNDFTQGLIADISPASTTPANKAVARSARYLAPPPRNMRVIVDMLDNKEGTDSRGWPYFEYFQQWQLPIRDLLPKVFNGEVAVKDGLQQAAEAGDRDAAAARA